MVHPYSALDTSQVIMSRVNGIDYKMQQLLEDYWTANKNNRHKAFPHFWRNINRVLRRYNCSCNSRHSCELKNCWATPPSLIALSLSFYILIGPRPYLFTCLSGLVLTFLHTYRASSLPFYM